MKRFLFAILLVGCAVPKDPPPAPTAEIDRQLVQAADAMARYRSGHDPEPTDQGKTAFRRECLLHESDREVVLDQSREHAQIHAYAWREWYRIHCTPVDGTVIDRTTGTTVDAWACAADAGSPPGYWYVHTPEENLARAQRDACERAQ